RRARGQAGRRALQRAGGVRARPVRRRRARGRARLHAQLRQHTGLPARLGVLGRHPRQRARLLLRCADALRHRSEGVRGLGLVLVVLGVVGMFLPVTDVPLGALENWLPPVGLAAASGGTWIFSRSLRGSGLGLSDPRAWRRFRRNKGAIAGGVLVLL